MRNWFILSVVGRDRPGIVAHLAQLIFDSDANLEDSRMTILGTEFAVILLCSAADAESGKRISEGAKRLGAQQELTIVFRPLKEGPRMPPTPPDARVFEIEAAGEDKAGIVASICGRLAEREINIRELSSRSRPGPSGSPHYELRVTTEIPPSVDIDALRAALESEADRLVIDISLHALDN